MTELKEKMKKFENCHVIFWPGQGHLIWRYDTGNTVQLCDIEAYQKRQGIGSRLLRQMVKEIGGKNVHGIYGFTAAKNKVAQKFYKAIGFSIGPKTNLYRGGTRLIAMTYRRAKRI